MLRLCTAWFGLDGLVHGPDLVSLANRVFVYDLFAARAAGALGYRASVAVCTQRAAHPSAHLPAAADCGLQRRIGRTAAPGLTTGVCGDD